WPSSDGKDDEWVRTHYYSPTQFVRTHYRVLAPVAPTPPGETGSTGNNPGPGTGTNPGTPSTDPTPGTPGTPGTTGDPGTPPTRSGWDGVPHLDGSLLKSSSGAYYWLQSGKKWLIASPEVLSTWARPEEALPVTDE